MYGRIDEGMQWIMRPYRKKNIRFSTLWTMFSTQASKYSQIVIAIRFCSVNIISTSMSRRGIMLLLLLLLLHDDDDDDMLQR